MEQEILLLVVAGFFSALGAGWVILRWRKSRGAEPARRSRTGPMPPAAASTLASALKRTRDRLQQVFQGPAASHEFLHSLEEALIAADVGMAITSRILSAVSARVGTRPTAEEIREALAEELVRVLSVENRWKGSTTGKPHVIVVVGVNGVGKTTSIAKLASWYRRKGSRVLLVAADTFRAAAAEQLSTWAERIGVDCIRHQAGADPAAVVFDGMRAAHSRDVDVVIIDTAGRMHSKQNLVQELAKIVRTVERQLGGGSMEVLLVIDATMGQNALEQAKVFSQSLPVSGVCLTKLDGTAKGGVVVGIANALGLPVRFVGFGESLEDWDEFRPEEFVRALLGEGGVENEARSGSKDEGRTQESAASTA